MTEVAEGDRVAIHFKGWLDEGTVFGSSEDREPLEFVAGSDEILKGLSLAVLGLTDGERKRVTLSPDQAYGHHNPALQRTVPRDRRLTHKGQPSRR